MGKRRSVQYINNADLLRHLSAWKVEYDQAKKHGQPSPAIPKYVGEAVYMIAERYATKGNFSGYSFREDMVGDACENCIKYLHNFNPEKSKNPFGYISLIVKNAFIRRIESEAKHSYMRHKLMVSSSFDLDQIDPSEIGHMDMADPTSNDKSSEIIENFERKLERKRDRARANNNSR